MTIRQQIIDRLSKLDLRRRLNLDDYWPGGWSPRPTLVSITPTYRCNLRCNMCYQRDDNGKPRIQDGELTPEQWEKVIDRVAAFAPAIYWIGGEIFVYPRMVELLAYARSTGLRVSFSTNGFSLADIADRVVDIGIESIAVSIDGSEEIHNAIRCSPKAFAWAIEGVKAVLEARRARGCRYPTVMVNFTITQQNYRHISDFYAFAQKLGVDKVQYVGLIYMSQATAQRHCKVMQTEFGLAPYGMDALYHKGVCEIDRVWLQKEMNQLWANAPASPSLRFWSLGVENHLEAHYGPDECLSLADQRCASVWRCLIIQPNGDVTVCPFLPEVVVGNVVEQDLHTIWNSALFKQFRKRIKQGLLPGCLRCTWAEYR